MILEQEERLSHEAIKTIVQQACLRSRQREDALYNRDVLEALHHLCGLPHSELAVIARGTIRLSPAFFSIKQQTVMAGGFVLGISGILFLAIRLFC